MPRRAPWAQICLFITCTPLVLAFMPFGGNFVRAREGLSRVPTSFGGAEGVRTVYSRRFWVILAHFGFEGA